MILLSPDVGAVSVVAVDFGAAFVFFCTPPVGAAMAALAFVAARRDERGLEKRPPRRPPDGLVSFIMSSRDWSSFPDMLIVLFVFGLWSW